MSEKSSPDKSSQKNPTGNADTVPGDPNATSTEPSETDDSPEVTAHPQTEEMLAKNGSTSKRSAGSGGKSAESVDQLTSPRLSSPGQSHRVQPKSRSHKQTNRHVGPKTATMNRLIKKDNKIGTAKDEVQLVTAAPKSYEQIHSRIREEHMRLMTEAEARQSQVHPIVRYLQPKSILLVAPNNIIFELVNTIVKQPSDGRLLEFIGNHLFKYLNSNWSSKLIQRSIVRLCREQVLDKLSTRGAQSSTEPQLGLQSSTSARQVHEYLMWKVKNNQVSQVSSVILKLALDDGYKSGNLKIEAYEDVEEAFGDWRSVKLIKLYAFGNAPAADQKLVLTSTSAGDLTKWISNYIDGSEKKQSAELIRKLAGALRDETHNCIFITNDLADALQSLQSGTLRCVFIVDRLNKLSTKDQLDRLDGQVRSLISAGKIYIMQSLACVEFAPDPSSFAERCC